MGMPCNLQTIGRESRGVLQQQPAEACVHICAFASCSALCLHVHMGAGHSCQQLSHSSDLQHVALGALTSLPGLSTQD